MDDEGRGGNEDQTEPYEDLQQPCSSEPDQLSKKEPVGVDRREDYLDHAVLFLLGYTLEQESAAHHDTDEKQDREDEWNDRRGELPDPVLLLERSVLLEGEGRDAQGLAHTRHDVGVELAR